MTKKKKIVIASAVTAVVLLSAGGAYFFFAKKSETPQSAENAEVADGEKTESADKKSDGKKDGEKKELTEEQKLRQERVQIELAAAQRVKKAATVDEALALPEGETKLAFAALEKARSLAVEEMDRQMIAEVNQIEQESDEAKRARRFEKSIDGWLKRGK